MLFTLEAVFAKHGDALILHYGPADGPSWVLIDGGPHGVYRSHLRPRLEQLREDWCASRTTASPSSSSWSATSTRTTSPGSSTSTRRSSGPTARQPLPFAIRGLWHNSFGDIAGPAAAEVAGLLSGAGRHRGRRRGGQRRTGPAAAAGNRAPRDGRAQPRLPRPRARSGPDGSSGRPGARAEPAGAVPECARIDAFRVLWEKALADLRARKRSAAEVAAMEDSSPSNLSSIVVLAEMAGRTMLLTGDAGATTCSPGSKQPGYSLPQTLPSRWTC